MFWSFGTPKRSVTLLQCVRQTKPFFNGVGSPGILAARILPIPGLPFNSFIYFGGDCNSYYFLCSVHYLVFPNCSLLLITFLVSLPTCYFLLAISYLLLPASHLALATFDLPTAYFEDEMWFPEVNSASMCFTVNSTCFHRRRSMADARYFPRNLLASWRWTQSALIISVGGGARLTPTIEWSFDIKTRQETSTFQLFALSSQYI